VDEQRRTDPQRMSRSARQTLGVLFLVAAGIASGVPSEYIGVGAVLAAVFGIIAAWLILKAPKDTD
jgi:hypothetical protein